MSFLLIFIISIIGLGLSLRKIAHLTRTSEMVLVMLIYPVLFLVLIILGWEDKIVSNLIKIGWYNFIWLIGVLTSCFLLIFLIKKYFALVKNKIPFLKNVL